MMRKEYKILSVLAVITVLFVGTVIVTTGALDPNSRFYGEWNVVDAGLPSNIVETSSTVTSADVFHITFEPDGGFQLAFYLDGEILATLHGTYTVVSDTQIHTIITGETLVSLTYSFSSKNMVLELTEESSGDTMVLNKIRDL